MYYADACWDCNRPEAKGLKLYTHCLIPVEDKNCFKNVNVAYSEYSCPLGYKDKYLNEAVRYLKILNEGKEDIRYELDQFMIKFTNILGMFKIEPFDLDWYKSKLKYEEYSALKYNYELKQKLQIIINYFKKYEYGEPIPYETFEQSLINTYLAKGMSENAAQSLLDRTMQLNERRSKKSFNSKATNCFVVGRTQELEI